MNVAGARAEHAAARHLARAGLRIVDRNWRCRAGEIDLVAEDGSVLVFVEVRFRSARGFGGALESVTRGKRHRLIAAARQYLAGRPERACRFDVVVMEGAPGRNLIWVRNAFGG